MKQRYKNLIRKAESGVTVSIQAIYYIFILFLFFALIYDFGGVAYTAAAGRAAAYAIAYKAAAGTDYSVFISKQEVRKNEDGVRQSVENGVAEAAAGGDMPLIYDLQYPILRSIGPRDLVVVEGKVAARTPLLGYLFGINEIEINVAGYADGSFGAGAEGQ